MCDGFEFTYSECDVLDDATREKLIDDMRKESPCMWLELLDGVVVQHMSGLDITANELSEILSELKKTYPRMQVTYGEPST